MKPRQNLSFSQPVQRPEAEGKRGRDAGHRWPECRRKSDGGKFVIYKSNTITRLDRLGGTTTKTHKEMPLPSPQPGGEGTHVAWKIFEEKREGRKTRLTYLFMPLAQSVTLEKGMREAKEGATSHENPASNEKLTTKHLRTFHRQQRAKQRQQQQQQQLPNDISN